MNSIFSFNNYNKAIYFLFLATGCFIGQDHSRALRACIRGPPKDWRRKLED